MFIKSAKATKPNSRNALFNGILKIEIATLADSTSNIKCAANLTKAPSAGVEAVTNMIITIIRDDGTNDCYCSCWLTLYETR